MHFRLLLYLIVALLITLVFSATTHTTVTAQTETAPTMKTIARHLKVPWAIGFLPNGNLIFTERPGRINILDKKTGHITKITDIRDVYLEQETGLLGIAVSPQFATNKHIFIYYTYKNSTIQNKVVRYKLLNNKLIEAKTIINGIPGNAFHNGGRLRFGPDNFLYVTTGDSNNQKTPQDINSLGGKILRVTEEGSPAPGNPFNNRTYTYGHRNPQGITWDGLTMYETEHGPSIPSCCDEINRLEAGKNYGWPDVKGSQTKPDTESPLLQTGTNPANTWAPSGTAFYKGSLFFAGLRGKALYEAKISGSTATIVNEHFKDKLGRIREVVVGPGNMLYITTSNHDGRGTPAADDDKIIQLNFNNKQPTNNPPQQPTHTQGFLHIIRQLFTRIISLHFAP